MRARVRCNPFIQLNNPFIVKFHDSFLEDEKFCIITEYCEVCNSVCVMMTNICQLIIKGGDLDLKIQSQKGTGKPFDLSLILDWFVQLTNAVRYIHERCGTLFITNKVTMVF